jgi:hypothetical protein
MDLKIIYALKTKMGPIVVVESRYGKGVFMMICMRKLRVQSADPHLEVHPLVARSDRPRLSQKGLDPTSIINAKHLIGSPLVRVTLPSKSSNLHFHMHL